MRGKPAKCSVMPVTFLVRPGSTQQGGTLARRRRYDTIENDTGHRCSADLSDASERGVHVAAKPGGESCRRWLLSAKASLTDVTRDGLADLQWERWLASVVGYVRGLVCTLSVDQKSQD